MAWMFTATHGVKFTDENGNTWAHFLVDPALSRREGNGDLKGYRFTTDDPSVAERLRMIRQYGITEVKVDG